MSVTRFDQQSLAWAMMNVVAPRLVPVDRTSLWVDIGAGDSERALVTLVGICVRNDIAVPADVAATLRVWLGGYYGTEVAAAFEPYVDGLPTTRSDSDVSSTREGLRTGCDRFTNRARRDPVGSARSWGFGRASDTG